MPLAFYPRLLHATPHQRSNWQLAGGGDGIHWPDIDEDLSAEGLVRGAAQASSSVATRRGLATDGYACTLFAGQREHTAVITNAKQGDDEPSGARSKNGVWVRLSAERWQHISQGHPELARLQPTVLEAITNAEYVLEGTAGELLAVHGWIPGKCWW